jgi:hypothetical protein
VFRQDLRDDLLEYLHAERVGLMHDQLAMHAEYRLGAGLQVNV